MGTGPSFDRLFDADSDDDQSFPVHAYPDSLYPVCGTDLLFLKIYREIWLGNAHSAFFIDALFCTGDYTLRLSGGFPGAGLLEGETN